MERVNDVKGEGREEGYESGERREGEEGGMRGAVGKGRKVKGTEVNENEER